VIPQQRQLLVLAQRPHIAEARPRTISVFVWHFKLLLEALEEASNP
jgi:hypothetical protein